MNKSIGVPVSDSEDDLIQVEDSDVNILDPVNTSTEETPTPKKRKSERKKQVHCVFDLNLLSILNIQGFQKLRNWKEKVCLFFESQHSFTVLDFTNGV